MSTIERADRARKHATDMVRRAVAAEALYLERLTWLTALRSELETEYEREILRLARLDVPAGDIAEAAQLHRGNLAQRERRAGLPPRVRGIRGGRPARVAVDDAA